MNKNNKQMSNNLKITVMKKKDFLWSLLAIVMAATMSLGLSSCGSDDDDDEVSVAMTQVSMDKSGGTQVIPVTSNTKWTAMSSASWLTVAPMQGSGNGSLMLTAQANTDTQSRSTVVTITAGDASAMIWVNQDGGSNTGADIAGNYVGTLKPMGYSDQPAPCYITIVKLSSNTYRLSSMICETFNINITSGVNLVATPQSDGRIQLTTETSYSVEGSYFQGTLTLSIGIGSDNYFFSGTKG